MPRTSGEESAAGEVVPAGGANGSAATEGNGAGPEHAAAQAAPAEADSSGAAGEVSPPAARPAWLSRPLGLMRRNWLATALLVLGLALRVLTQVSFSPALLYIDSVKYLYGAWPYADPLGYDLPLKLILAVGNLSAVEAVQHLLGLGMAVTIYVVLLRRGVPRWLAALAMGPVLLDAYQLQMEATIMPDLWFEAALLAGLAVLVWMPRATVRICLLAGFILGLSATIRQVGEILIIPLLIIVIAMGGGWRNVLGKTLVTALAFIMPIFLYMSASLYINGHFWLSRNGQESAYGRLAGLVDCSTLKIPSYEQPLCPTTTEQSYGADWLDHALTSPLRNYALQGGPPGLTRGQAIKHFEESIIRQQPVAVFNRIATDSFKLFSVTRHTDAGDTPISRWQFHTAYPNFLPTIAVDKDGTIVFGLKLASGGGALVYHQLDTAYGGNAHVWVPGAAFLRRYQVYGGYTPGPLLLLCFLAGLAGTLTIFRRRASPAQRQLAVGALAFFVTGVVILLLSNLFEFSWRYQMPALVTLPPAGALGIAAVLRFARRRKLIPIRPPARQEERVTAKAG
ncbi:MAG: hypothetical protein ACRDPO_09015 [Streptosporangiaceae bacterium]